MLIKDKVEFYLDKFQIGEPIKSLFSPKFSVLNNIIVLIDERIVTVQLEIYTPDAFEEKGNILVLFRDNIYLWGNVNDEAAYCAKFFRAMLHKALMHEADEAIVFDGKRVFNPHD